MAAPAYEVVTWRGHTFDRKTIAGIEHWEYLLGDELIILQGSYNGGDSKVAQSGGTHDGGGAGDLDYVGRKSPNQVTRCGRLAGFAVWNRPTLPGVWNQHWHAVQVGNAKLSVQAQKQVQDYFAGLNGLAGHAPDRTWRPNPIVPFRYPLPVVDLSNVRRVQEQSRPKPLAGVKQVQRALNLKTGTQLKVDGVWGRATDAAYRRFERQLNPKADGRVNRRQLMILGAARFRVKS